MSASSVAGLQPETTPALNLLRLSDVDIMQRSLTTDGQDNDPLLHPAVRTVDTWHLHQAWSPHIITRLQKEVDKSPSDYNNSPVHSLSSVAHFPRDTRYFRRNVGKHWIDWSILKSGVDTYEDQILRVMIEAYRLALR